jgi:hypothetical protein
MFVDLDNLQGEWFSFFGSHIDPSTGETIFEEPVSDARVQIRSMIPFVEERMAKRKKSVEHVYNPKTRAMERISYYPELSLDESKTERDDAWDYIITAIENFKDSKTNELILCTRENKLKLMKVPVFDRFVARCLQILTSSGVKMKEEEIKNVQAG